MSNKFNVGDVVRRTGNAPHLGMEAGDESVVEEVLGGRFDGRNVILKDFKRPGWSHSVEFLELVRRADQNFKKGDKVTVKPGAESISGHQVDPTTVRTVHHGAGRGGWVLLYAVRSSSGGDKPGNYFRPVDLLPYRPFQPGDVVDAYREDWPRFPEGWEWAANLIVTSVDPDGGTVHTKDSAAARPSRAFSPSELTLVSRAKPNKLDVKVGDTVTVKGVLTTVGYNEVVRLNSDTTELVAHEPKATPKSGTFGRGTTAGLGRPYGFAHMTELGTYFTFPHPEDGRRITRTLPADFQAE